MSRHEPETLTVIARAPFRIYYEGTAASVTATNRIGTFDVLPGHADFFSMLEACTATIITDENEISFPITNGLLTVRDNQVLLFVNM